MTAEAIARAPASTAAAPPSQLRFWLFFISLLVFAMVLVGGATRLTNSGLSITEWQPLAGIFPPMNAADWQILFDKYKQIPQFNISNPGMDVEGFKYIFWWEWTHRILGRVIGGGLLLILVVYGLRRKLSIPLASRIFVLCLLVAAQGALGWYMVKSGLVDRVDVSQYRLSAHLVLACICFAAIIWVALGVGTPRSLPRGFGGFMAVVILGLLLLQIAAGGFVAGLDAGHASNTWPKMEDQWIPQSIWTLQPVWKNALENAMAVQFNHRMLAYAIFALTLLHGWITFRPSAMILLYLMFVQVGLGILVVIFKVPTGFALSHQATALVTLAVAVWNVHSFSKLRLLPAPDQQ
jgi:heme a synthase